MKKLVCFKGPNLSCFFNLYIQLYTHFKKDLYYIQQYFFYRMRTEFTFVFIKKIDVKSYTFNVHKSLQAKKKKKD